MAVKDFNEDDLKYLNPKEQTFYRDDNTWLALSEKDDTVLVSYMFSTKNCMGTLRQLSNYLKDCNYTKLKFYTGKDNKQVIALAKYYNAKLSEDSYEDKLEFTLDLKNNSRLRGV